MEEKMDVKKIRNKLNMTQTEFGNIFGVTDRHVRNWESGATKMNKIYQYHLKNLIKKEK